MSDHGYEFQVVTVDGAIAAQSFEVFSYPMGDITVRVIPDRAPVAGTIQMLQINRTAVDWTLVQEWSTLAEHLFPGQPRVLSLPYLPSARGDKDVPSPAAVNATNAARSGITDIITIDPHSPVWLSTLRDINPLIRQHTLPLGNIVRRALTVDEARSAHLGVISPDKGAVARAGEVATLLGLPLYVADKHRDPTTGHLTHYSLNADLAAGAYLVVDDIFDGGGTFALLAGAVPDSVVLDLWVTHGGFTKPNFSADARAPYRRIYTTDSLNSAVAASLEHKQIHVTALAPWIACVVNPGAAAERRERSFEVGECR
jgi:ribose-phosphate pyrophosphokinase